MSMLGGEEMELGKQIKKHRQEVQLSQEELAERVYVSRQTISNWENLHYNVDRHCCFSGSVIHVTWCLGTHSLGYYPGNLNVFRFYA